MIKYTWDYNPPEGFKYYEGYQEDWNQTLLIKLNEIYVERGFESQCILVKVPIKFINLINSLFYMNKDRNMLGDKYFIEFRDYDSNIIFMESYRLEILNFNEQE
jgi:hypothetical protein